MMRITNTRRYSVYDVSLRGIYDRANEEFLSGSYDQAEEWYSVAVVLVRAEMGSNADDSVKELCFLLANRSAARCRLEKFEESLRDAEECLAMKPNWAKAHYRKALALRGLERTSEALQSCETALHLQSISANPDPQAEYAYVDLANVLRSELGLAMEYPTIEDMVRPVPASSTSTSNKPSQPSSTSTNTRARPTTTSKTSRSAIPAIVLSGFLGSGKTTLVKRILTELAPALRVIVLVNDMSEINMDAAFLASSQVRRIVYPENRPSPPQLVEFTNGCICCTLKEDLVRELFALDTRRFDLVVVESSGISEPLPVAQAFVLSSDAHGRSLASMIDLHCMITVVDASTILNNLHTGPSLKRLGMATTPSDERDISKLLTDQIEFADLILVNKLDLLVPPSVGATSSTTKEEVLRLVRALNPTAEVMQSVMCREVDLHDLITTKRFDRVLASRREGWLRELILGEGGHLAETEQYGITSWVWDNGPGVSAEKKLDARKFHAIMTALDGRRFGIVRSKGLVSFAQDPRVVVQVETAGPHTFLRTIAVEGGAGGENVAGWRECVVFIGINPNWEALKEAMKEACCSTMTNAMSRATPESVGASLFSAVYQYVYEIDRLEYLSNLTRPFTASEAAELERYVRATMSTMRR